MATTGHIAASPRESTAQHATQPGRVGESLLDRIGNTPLLRLELVANNGEKYFYPDQYSNPANWQAHYRTTANEIWEQTSGRITHFVAGLGTSGTFVGTTRRLKELNPAIRCVSLQPDASFHGLEGW